MDSKKQEKQYAVFLSFNSEDREAVETLAKYLKNTVNLFPWFDQWELIPGEQWIQRLWRGLEASATCAVFVGESGEGPWQNREIEKALMQQVQNRDFRVIPVLLPGAPKQPQLPPFLAANMWVDFRQKGLDDDHALWLLECGIRGEPPGEGRPASPPTVEQPIPIPLADLISFRNAYLNWLFEHVSRLSLAGIDRKAASSEAEARLNLGAIYTALLTLSTEHKDQERAGFDSPLEGGQGGVVPSSDGPGVGSDRRLSAVAQLNQQKRLVLLGDPGSGKSTFVDFVVMCLAGEQLGDSQANLNLLKAPLPNDEGEDEEKQQPWEYGALLPVRVILRDFAARGLPPTDQPAKAKHLWDFISKELEDATLGHYAPYLQQHLQTEGGLLLLDGLDEVPEADQRRTQIKQAVEDFACAFPNCRVLVTSRTYAYQKQDWRLQGFSEAALAPFTRGQIRRFVDRWYTHIGTLRGMNPDDASGRAELLKRAILSSDRLYSFAERPLLLTLMASLHAWRGGSLPEEREKLYDDTVELLLDWWESGKVVRDAAGNMIVAQPSLTELLNVGRESVRNTLNLLAFQAHAGQPGLAGTADVPEEKLVSELMQLNPDKDLRPRRLIEHLSDRAGLLVPRGVAIYTFPHRTFQEYLAACHLADEDDYPENIAELARKEPNRWREVVLLAGARAARGAAGTIWMLAEELCYQDFPGSAGVSPASKVPGSAGVSPASEVPGSADILSTQHAGETPALPEVEDAWGALLASQALTEIIDPAKLRQPSPRNLRKIERIRRWLAAILTEQAPPDTPFPATERALAGNILAQLGDPRPGVGLREDGLPDILWCEVPAGAFLMGSNDYDVEKPPHEVHVSAFQISRYPITNAQYRVFIEDGGYAEKWEDCWTPEGWAWKEEGNISGPWMSGGLFDISNHPVVGVSWYEAVAFCNWLTMRLRETPPYPPQGGKPTPDPSQEGKNTPLHLPQGGIIRLPTEAEWEKATRGTNGRIYPWGNEIEPEYANYDDTGLGATSVVGCFPRGISPYGCEDMAGNVLEWCADPWHKNYKGAPKDGCVWEEGGDTDVRLLRGGSWVSLPDGCRAAGRNGNYPVYRLNNRGFRVVVGSLPRTL